jgi:transcriptional regulator with XRE-family HTH domain
MTLAHMRVGNTIGEMRRVSDGDLRAALGRVFADIRLALGIQQGEVADQTTISKVENGANFPSWPTLLALCRRYQVDVSDVLRAAEESLAGKPGRSVVAVETDERELLKLYRDCTAEGRRVLMDRAKAVHTLYPKS